MLHREDSSISKFVYYDEDLILNHVAYMLRSDEYGYISNPYLNSLKKSGRKQVFFLVSPLPTQNRTVCRQNSKAIATSRDFEAYLVSGLSFQT